MIALECPTVTVSTEPNCQELLAKIELLEAENARLRQLDVEFGKVETAIIMADPDFDGDSAHPDCGARLVDAVERMARHAYPSGEFGELRLVYRNHRGRISERRISTDRIRMSFGSNEWHPDPQYLLHAFDLDIQAWRHFALRDCQFSVSEVSATAMV